MFAHNLRVRIPQSNLISELSAFLNPTEHSGYFETSANSQQISGHSLQGPGMQLSICSTANFKSSLKILQKVHIIIYWFCAKFKLFKDFQISKSMTRFFQGSFLGSHICNTCKALGYFSGIEHLCHGFYTRSFYMKFLFLKGGNDHTWELSNYLENFQSLL